MEFKTITEEEAAQIGISCRGRAQSKEFDCMFEMLKSGGVVLVHVSNDKPLTEYRSSILAAMKMRGIKVFTVSSDDKQNLIVRIKS